MGRYLEQIEKERIEEIMNGMGCQKDFRCLKEGLENIKFDRPFEGWNIFKCMRENPRECPFSHSYGYCHICKCPLLNHIDIVRKLENGYK